MQVHDYKQKTYWYITLYFKNGYYNLSIAERVDRIQYLEVNLLDDKISWK